MLKTQRQIVEQLVALQEAIEQELKEKEERLSSGDWDECSEGERQRRGIRARIEVLEQALQKAEVRKYQRLSQYLTWEVQQYQETLTRLRVQSEKQKPVVVVPAVVVPAKPTVEPRRKARQARKFSQQEIDEVLNPALIPFSQRFLRWLRECWQGFIFSLYHTYSPDPEDDEFIQMMEEHIQKAELRLRKSGNWERLPESEKALWLIEEKIESCDFTIEEAIVRRRPNLLRYALRAKECYTICLDALKMEHPSS